MVINLISSMLFSISHGEKFLGILTVLSRESKCKLNSAAIFTVLPLQFCITDWKGSTVKTARIHFAGWNFDLFEHFSQLCLYIYFSIILYYFSSYLPISYLFPLSLSLKNQRQNVIYFLILFFLLLLLHLRIDLHNNYHHQ